MKLQNLFETDGVGNIERGGKKLSDYGNVFRGQMLILGDLGLTSLNGIPNQIDDSLIVTNNDLSSFESFPKIINGDLSISKNKFTSFKDISKHITTINGRLSYNGNSIKSNFLSLLRIKGLKQISGGNEYQEVDRIINKYLPEGDILECQSELMDAGLEEYAKL